MKILHYIDDFDPIRLPKEYFELLANDADEELEVHLLMPKPEYDVEVEGVQVHYLSYFKWVRWKNKRRFCKVMDEVNPDIINIHSCWSSVMADIVDWNEKFYKRPLILSTHKLLMPWHNSNILQRFLHTRLYQQKIVEKADVILTDSPQETNIQTNLHVVNIPNALLVPGYSEEQMRSDYATLCETLSNSNPYLFMTDEEKQKEVMLLKEAVMQKQHVGNKHSSYTSIEPSDSSSSSAAPLSGLGRIILHAQYEGTLKILLPFLPNGAKDYADNTLHYVYNTKKNVDTLYSVKMLSGKSDLEAYGKEEKATENDLLIIRLLLNVKHEIVHNSISQRHLIELYKALKTTYYDEDTLNVILLRMGALQDTARLMQLLKDYYNLEEGFMPMEPLDDDITRKIKDKLLLWQVQG